MIFWLLVIELAVALLAGLMNLTLGFLGRAPSLVSISAVGVVELALLVQVLATVILLGAGEAPVASLFEFLGYLLVALLIPLGATFWGTVERTKQSTIVLGIAPLVVAVMLVRMQQLWVG
jgi:hypothetical protein